MSTSSESSRVDYTGNGTQSVFPYSYKIFKEDDLTVTVREVATGVETLLVKTTDYTVSGVGETSGGNVTLVDAAQAWVDGSGDLDTGYVMTIRRDPDIIQETDIRNQGQYFPEGIENQFDKQTFIDQKQQDEIDRSVKNPETLTTSTFDPTLPAGMVTPDSALVSNPTGDGFAVGPTTSAIASAQADAIDAGEHRDTAKLWATKVDGSVVDVDTGVDSLEYSAQAYALGGTGVTATATKGAAKEWAIETAATVDGTDYSSKEHAVGIQTRGLAGGGSAKDWAQYTVGTVDDTEFSAKKYATDAATSAAQAATNAAGSLWNDVSFKVFGDSPIAIVDGDAGTLFAIDCSGGNVVVNLPSIAVLTLTGPWAVGFKKTDTSANTITINPSGAEEIDSVASAKVISRVDAAVTLLPDDDPTPDNWTSITYGEIPIAGDIVGTTDAQTLTNKTFDDEVTMQEIASPATPASGYNALYFKTDGDLYKKDDAGVEVALSSAGSTNNSPMTLENLGLETSAAGSALTVSLKQADGSTDPAAGTGAVKIAFRDLLSADGGFSIVEVTAATSVTITSGATLGLRSGENEDVFVYAMNDAGTVSLAISTRLREENVLASAVPVTGASDLDSLYATGTVSSKAIRLIGKLVINEATIGTWSGVADQVILAGGQKLDYSVNFLSVTSSIKTANVPNVHQAMTNSSLIPPPGNWKCSGLILCDESGTAGWTAQTGGWYSANGTDAAGNPASVDAPSTVSIIGGLPSLPSRVLGADIVGAARVPAPDAALSITGATEIFLVPRSFMVTPANSRISTYLILERIKG